MLVVSGLEMGESLVSRNETDDPGAQSSLHLVQSSFLCFNRAGTWSFPGRRGSRTSWPSSTASASTSGHAETSGQENGCGSGTARTT